MIEPAHTIYTPALPDEAVELEEVEEVPPAVVQQAEKVELPLVAVEVEQLVEVEAEAGAGVEVE